jgi:hypothetical protein
MLVYIYIFIYRDGIDGPKETTGVAKTAQHKRKAYLAGEKVEVRRVELVGLVEVGQADAEVADLVHRRGPLL